MKYKFTPGRGLIKVPVLIKGPDTDIAVKLALDTGATQTVIGWDALVRAGYDPASIKDRLQLTTGSGIEYAPVLTVSNLEALGQVRNDIEVVCHTMPSTSRVDGILGLDFYNGLRLTIDFRLGEVELS